MRDYSGGRGGETTGWKFGSSMKWSNGARWTSWPATSGGRVCRLVTLTKPAEPNCAAAAAAAAGVRSRKLPPILPPFCCDVAWVVGEEVWSGLAAWWACGEDCWDCWGWVATWWAEWIVDDNAWACCCCCWWLKCCDKKAAAAWCCNAHDCDSKNCGVVVDDSGALKACQRSQGMELSQWIHSGGQGIQYSEQRFVVAKKCPVRHTHRAGIRERGIGKE